MTAIRSHHSRVFEQKIAERRQQLLEGLATGQRDVADYWLIVGKISGIAEAMKISEAADFELSGEEPDAST